MTITTGAALAPDDDTSTDPEDSDISQETATSAETSGVAGHSVVVTSEVVGGISLAIAPDVVSANQPAVPPDEAGSTTALAVSPEAAQESTRPPPADDPVAGTDSPLLAVIALSTAESPAAAPRVPLGDRVRGALPFTGPGLTRLGGVVLGCLVVGLGAAGDLAAGGGLGTAFTATFLIACVLVAGALRTRALAVAVILPPLLYAGGLVLETRSGGHTSGSREMALDVATSLALHAPVLFVGTALAVAVTIVRVIVRLIRR